MNKLNFYQVLLKTQTEIKFENITDNQLESIERADFFNLIPEKDFKDVSFNLLRILSYYNYYDLGYAPHLPTTKEDKAIIQKCINTTNHFIDMLKKTEINPINIYGDDRVEFFNSLELGAEKVLDALEDERIFVSKKIKTSKTELREFVYKQICEKYNIKKSREVKHFIDKLDEYEY